MSDTGMSTDGSAEQKAPEQHPATTPASTTATSTATTPGVQVGLRPIGAPLRLRSYVPLIAIVLLSAIMAVLGVASSRGWLDREVAAPASTPTECRSEVPPGDPTIWTGERTPASEEVFAANTAALTVPAVTGKDGFVFWSDIQLHNFSQMLGRAPWLDEQRDQWRDYFSELEDGLRQEGAELLVVVAPSSGTVYPQMLPEWSEPLRGLTHLDQLLAVSDDLPIVDLRGSLMEASEDDWVYSAVNSHWTPYGAYVAWEQIGSCLQALYPESGYEAIEVSEVTSVEAQDPPNEFSEWGFETPRQDWTVPVLETAPTTTVKTGPDGSTSDLTWPEGVDPVDLPVTTTGGDIDKLALVVGDSQGKALSALWAQSFTSTFQIRHFLDDMSQRANVLDAARQSGADLVVLELTERFFSTPPPTVLR